MVFLHVITYKQQPKPPCRKFTRALCRKILPENEGHDILVFQYHLRYAKETPHYLPHFDRDAFKEVGQDSHEQLRSANPILPLTNLHFDDFCNSPAGIIWQDGGFSGEEHGE